ncbi:MULTISPECIES: MmyB family transcriptional regulator [unclassified Rhodococcus (in: high G+C Gram-positive bacteria)]|uniref:helix-turn-helix domain-containing protein n=1 Tax=Rhodococcus sp. SJ-3 TaxID=3454628 RepID=UPI003F79B74F
MPSSELGDFLRSRRAQISPLEVGLRSYGTRRVRGLRREEVAITGGLSSDYYTRLEQGRERHPSVQVLDALSRALRLDADQEMHLYRLAGLVPSIHGSGAPESVGAALLQLMDTFDSTPAFVLNRTLDIVACNPLAVALFSPFASADNLVRMVFTDPAGILFYADWRRAAQATVATLRLAVGHDSHDARLARLVDEVSAVSPEFRQLWDEGEVRGKTMEAKKFVHPQVGALTLTFHAFDVREQPGLQMVIYRAERGSPSDEALRLLGSLIATSDRERENATAGSDLPSRPA